MRVAVVGANGFLGSHMVDSLVTSGHEVIAVDRFSSPPRFIHTPHLTITTDDPGNSGLVTQLPTVDAVIDVLGASTPLLSAENPRFDE
jgi:UDP-glucose 4-epimerase